MGSSFVPFDAAEITPKKTSLPVGKRYLPMGKRANVTTANVSVVCWLMHW